MVYSNTQLGYFITFELWQDALALLNYQLESMNYPNRHFYTLSMFYYQKLHSQFPLINDKVYFEQKVANNLFYGMANEFGIYPYLQPKGGLGLRDYFFYTYPARVLYYAVGLYLLKLTESLLKDLANPRVKSFYGGNLEYSGNKLSLKPQSVYYKEHYRRFRRHVFEKIKTPDEHIICLKMDLQSYFDSINIEILLNQIESRLSQHIKDSFTYNSYTIEQIKFFFRFIRKGKIGIPQMDNGIISDFIGYIYMVLGDDFISSLLQSRIEDKSIQDFEIYRYVDDTYIFFKIRTHFFRC